MYQGSRHIKERLEPMSGYTLGNVTSVDDDSEINLNLNLNLNFDASGYWGEQEQAQEDDEEEEAKRRIDDKDDKDEDEDKNKNKDFVEIEYYTPQVVICREVDEKNKKEEFVYKLKMLKSKAIVKKFQRYITSDNTVSGVYEEIKVGKAKYHKVCKNPYNDGRHVMNLLFGTGLSLDNGQSELDCEDVVITSVTDL
jgi:hypothetical protein